MHEDGSKTTPADRARKLDRREPRATAAPEDRTTLLEAQRSVGNFLRATRESLNLTQAEVSDRTNKGPWRISRAAVSAIERGQNFPGLEAMLALSNVLHIDPKELIERARLTAVVPADMNDLSSADLETRAHQFFWAGDFKRALAVYDVLLDRAQQDSVVGEEPAGKRLARLEVQRATALRRGSALASALASAERAISLAATYPDVQSEAYAVLASVQCQRGHLPLAGDAAQRAIDLARSATPAVRARAWMVQGQVLSLAEKHEEARQAFLSAREEAEAGGDLQHLTHIDGNIGTCWLALGHVAEAQRCFERAVASARERRQVALEASWLVELGKIAVREGDLERGDRLAEDALRIADAHGHVLTAFRAEWLRHKVADQRKQPVAQRIRRLHELFVQLRQHEGFEEIREFASIYAIGPAGGEDA